ncbi:P-loop containing nucleoside triphosphate hydrolase [Arabidopsis thaliana x Arabidopsis arenosa]|uniref:P-loop containing nucleoside triphosphate hydrolase n=1 Tax=Arabidopsis thaliana x Arabidopsis arenosa TaxID=1240361 RepID=A0A8T1YV42_9BRAS|nr:P-loop containing nucleoside triphosphate hydrolase [Arabidopsis thaliana x Arabidopsis arenosa]
MILAQLPRFHLSILAKPSFALSSSHFNFLNPKSSVEVARTLFSFTSKSNLATVEPIPLSVSDSSDLDDAPFEISLDKLFIPPETDISGEDSTSLTARILKGSNIVLSKYARDAQVVQADYVKSSVKTEDCPADGLPEFALVGRSNVGKSSLLNSLVRRKRLALTSKKPGKTQCINHFRINDKWYLVDLPGYGYASAPHELKQDWNKFTKDYFLNRSTLVSVFLLVDASIPVKQIDLEYASWLGQNQVPMTLIFTKCDKRKKKKNGGKKPEENIKEFQDLIQGFFETTPPWIMTSSVTNQGRDEILLHMAQLRNYWLKH